MVPLLRCLHHTSLCIRFTYRAILQSLIDSVHMLKILFLPMKNFFQSQSTLVKSSGYLRIIKCTIMLQHIRPTCGEISDAD